MISLAYTVVIPDFLPTRLNVLLRMHWAQQRRVTKSEAMLVAVYGRGVPRATGPRRVSYRFLSPRTPADPDGRLKNLQDALVACGLLVDDSPAWYTVGEVASERGPTRQTIITLEDPSTPPAEKIP